jgi:hypothetical protein
MPDKMSGDGYDELITPINEEGNRTGNDPDTHNVPSAINPPDPLGLTHGIFSDKGGARKSEKAPPKGK